MKTSQMAAMQQVVLQIEQYTNELMKLGKCTVVQCKENNHVDGGQITIIASASDAVGSKVVEAWKTVLEERKTLLVIELREKYGVEYDGK